MKIGHLNCISGPARRRDGLQAVYNLAGEELGSVLKPRTGTCNPDRALVQVKDFGVTLVLVRL